MTVKVLLEAMNLASYNHVVIQKRVPESGLVGLGGGFQDVIVSRFGELEVQRTFIVDNMLHIVVYN